MSLKIRLENIQAIADASLEVEGFTAVVGRSNSGKSSIVRGMHAAITNKSPQILFRNGTKMSRIQIDDDAKDIHIEWKKGDKVNAYVLNGDEHTKVGSTAPPKIAEWGFKDVAVGKESIEVQIARQHNYLFLINKSGSFVADFISKITKVDMLTGAMKDCEADARSCNESIKATDQEIETLATEISRFSELDNLGLQIEKLKEYQAEVKSLEAEVALLDGFSVEAKKLIFQRNSLSAIPSVPVCECNLSEIKQISVWASEYDELKTVYLKSKEIESVQIGELDFDIQTLKDIEACLELKAALDFTIPDVPELDTSISDLVYSISSLHSLIDQQGDIEAELDSIRDQLAQTNGHLEQLETRKAKVEASLGHCPLCKKGFHENHDSHSR